MHLCPGFLFRANYAAVQEDATIYAAQPIVAQQG
jgi:hypothetical protein